MHVMRAFIGVDRLEVLRVAHHMIAAGDAVGAVDVARQPRDVERLAAIVALDDARSSRAPIGLRPSGGRPAGEACSPSAISVCMSASFFWTSWVAASGRPNCLRSKRVVARAPPAILRRAHRAPRNAVAGAVEAAERPLEAGDIGQASGPRRLRRPFITISPVIEARNESLPSILARKGPSCPFPG